ncbi:SDR family NAD(P)-dependent oxidoreductase [uncultured Ruegeria sp.]|uniref:SDR family NAD(P)-dependent oxidoreductase n=1 Tax=uncultured Ruegeria sp. TaxID=259304 RepID=UPI00261E3EE2|nr:SDR family NAD(P)-dependent oxidoreductase [uncultured Ruegeria sp.]
MKTALIIGATGGIGRALSDNLQAQGVEVTGLSRSDDGFDLADPEIAEHMLSQVAGPFDLIIVASGALEINGAEPEKSLRAVSARGMLDQFALNAVGPALVLKQAHRLLPRDRNSVIAVLSARVGSIEDNRLGGWVSYRAAKTAVNQIVHTTAIELARTHKQAVCVALHPGTVKTAFTQKYLGRHPAVEPEEAAANLLAVIDALTPSETGNFYDWAGKRVPW